MAILRIVDGPNSGQTITIDDPPVIIGRHPTCSLVLAPSSVSRFHAQIDFEDDLFQVRDLESRNGTELNGRTIDTPMPLADYDEIRIGEVLIRFRLSNDPELQEGTDLVGLGESNTAAGLARLDPSTDLQDEASIVKTLSAGEDGFQLQVRPEAKLRAILKVTSILGQHLQLEETLRGILGSLFSLFPAMDTGFVLTPPVGHGYDENERLVLRAARSRTGDEVESRPSMTVVRQALKNREAILSTNAQTDQRFDSSESLDSLSIRSTMCIPLFDRNGHPLGAVQVNSKTLHTRFTEEDLELLLALQTQIVLALDYAHLHEEMVRQRNLQRDVSIAQQVQQGFLPQNRPEHEAYIFDDFYEAARNVGGDYFDYQPRPDGRIGFALADVAGKGVAAALLMARLFAEVRSRLASADDAASALTEVNAAISQSRLGHRFITGVIGLLDPETHTIALANAGHLPPVIRRADGSTEALDRKTSGLPLGVASNTNYRETTISLAPGDGFLLYTDGITETMNAERDLFGIPRLQRRFAKAGADPERTLKFLLRSVDDFGAGSDREQDDMCMMLIARRDAEQVTG